jgi:hypothetical protein
MEQEGEQLVSGEVQPGLTNLDLGIEPLGQEPESIGARQAATAHGVSDTAQVVRHRVRQVSQGLQRQQVLGQHIEQQLARTVGKRVQPLTDSRAGRTGFGQLAQQVFPA